MPDIVLSALHALSHLITYTSTRSLPINIPPKYPLHVLCPNMRCKGKGVGPRIGGLASSPGSGLSGCISSRKLSTVSEPHLPHLKNMHVLLNTH